MNFATTVLNLVLDLLSMNFQRTRRGILEFRDPVIGCIEGTLLAFYDCRPNWMNPLSPFSPPFSNAVAIVAKF